MKLPRQPRDLFGTESHRIATLRIHRVDGRISLQGVDTRWHSLADFEDSTYNSIFSVVRV